MKKNILLMFFLMIFIICGCAESKRKEKDNYTYCNLNDIFDDFGLDDLGAIRLSVGFDSVNYIVKEEHHDDLIDCLDVEYIKLEKGKEVIDNSSTDIREMYIVTFYNRDSNVASLGIKIYSNGYVSITKDGVPVYQSTVKVNREKVRTFFMEGERNK